MGGFLGLDNGRHCLVEVHLSGSQLEIRSTVVPGEKVHDLLLAIENEQ
jgi:hypothetical protein